MMPLVSFLALMCIVSTSATDKHHNVEAAIAQQMKKVSQHVALKVDAHGNIEDASELIQRADNLAQQNVQPSAQQHASKAADVSKDKEVKALGAAGQVDNSVGKTSAAIVRAESAQNQDSLRQKFMDTMDSWEHRFFAWKHDLVAKTEAKTNSLWERIQSNATAEFPQELRPAELLSTYCYESESSECWYKKFEDVKSCKDADAHAGQLWRAYKEFPTDVACRCSDHGDDLCNVNSLAQTMVATARCEDLRVYINKAGKREETHCAKMVKNKEWKAMGLVAQERDGPARKDIPWYKWCGFGYVSKDGECKRKQRFLTESCWGGNGHGACAGSDIAHDEFATSCYKGQCMPQSFVQTSVECSCSSTGWRFPFACTAEKDQCAGHPCIWNEGHGKSYCNFAEKQNWNDATNIIATVVVTSFAFTVLTAIGVMFWMLMPSMVKASIMHELGMTKKL